MEFIREIIQGIGIGGVLGLIWFGVLWTWHWVTGNIRDHPNFPRFFRDTLYACLSIGIGIGVILSLLLGKGL